MYKLFGSPLDQLTPLGMETYLAEGLKGRRQFWLDLLKIKVRDYFRSVNSSLPFAFRWIAWILTGHLTNEARAFNDDKGKLNFKEWLKEQKNRPE